ncbi:MAG: GNAT family N-acetyltransferase [Myxococcota bacterium]|nr:GNAT family N-acetyltransferase [Myxococcota bacterium]
MNQHIPSHAIRIVLAPRAEFEACLRVRTRVFVEEQGVPSELEEDAFDPVSTHWLALAPDGPVGTARARRIGRAAKAERVAVDSDFRGQGVGRRLMEAIESWAREQDLESVQLNAQIRALPFYLRLGYQANGSIFEEAGIPHRALVKSLTTQAAG